MRIATDTSSSRIYRSLRGRVSQAWKPLRDTPSASHIQLTGQAPRCFATNPNITAGPWRSRRPLFFRMSRSAFSLDTSRCRLRSSSCSSVSLPFPGKAAGRSAAAARTHRRSTVACIPRSLEACAALTPRFFSNSTASCLNSRLNFLSVTSFLKSHKRLISVSTKPAAGPIDARRFKLVVQLLRKTFVRELGRVVERAPQEADKRGT